MLDATPLGETVTVEEVSAALRERGYFPFTVPLSPAVSPALFPAYPEIPVLFIPALSPPIRPEPPYIPPLDVTPLSPPASPAVIAAGAKSPWLLIGLLGGLILLSGKGRPRAGKKRVDKFVDNRGRS